MEGKLLKSFLTYVILCFGLGLQAQVDCLKSTEKYLEDLDAVIVLKEPYCKACLQDVSQYLDSVGVRKRKILVLFESGGGGAYQLRIENAVMEKMRIRRRNVLALAHFDCELLNGLYYAYRSQGEVVWKSIP